MAGQLLSPIPTRGVGYVHLIFSKLPPALPNQQEKDLTSLVIDDIKNLDCLLCMYLCNGIFIRFHLHMPITPPILSEIRKKNWMVFISRKDIGVGGWSRKWQFFLTLCSENVLN